MWKYIGSLFSLGFWFNLTAVPFLPWIDKALLILLTGLLLAGVALHVYTRKTSLPKDMRPVYVGATAWLVWAAVVGFLLYGFTWQRGIISYPQLASGETREGERPHNALWLGHRSTSCPWQPARQQYGR
jgi:hypothetical protein